MWEPMELKFQVQQESAELFFNNFVKKYFF